MSAEPRRRVLLVDDEPVNVRVLAATLEDEHTLLFATDGARALELAPAVDLVLLDVAMPGMDGFEVCRRLKADDATRSIPVIFVTAKEQVEDEAAGFAAGGVDYITKPISPPIVRARVRTHLELKEARDLLARQASIDGLTGIANRRSFDEALEREWRRATRADEWLSLILVDLDWFKALNDRYGHARGDEALRAVASTMAELVSRPGDVVARVGGEELAALLPATDAPGAREVMVALLRRIHALGIENAGSPPGGALSASAGGISLRPRRHTAAADAFEAADRLLYEAKEAGRDQGVHVNLETAARARIEPKPQGDA